MTLPEDDDDLLPAKALDERTAALQAVVHGLTRERCRTCGSALCGHAALLAVVFGYRNAPRCASCLAQALGETPAAACERALHWIRRRDCFRHVFERASRDEGVDMEHPACIFPAGAAPAADASPRRSAASTAPPVATATYDAGDLGCGDLVLELRFRLQDLAPRAVLHVTARDPAAPVDLPAWCGLCGHTLLHASHPHYWIRKRD